MQMRNWSNKRICGGAAGAAVMIVFCTLPPFGGMETAGMRALGATLCAIMFWALGVLPDWVTALGLLVLWMTAAGIPSATAFNGFTSESLWLILCAYAMAEAVQRTGLFARISWKVISMFRPSFRGLVMAVIVCGLIFAPLIPSATAKAVLGASIALSLADAMGYEKHSAGRTGLFIASFTGFSVCTSAFMSGNVFTFTLYGILPEEVKAEMSWGNWLIASLPWLVIMVTLSYAGIVFLFGRIAAGSQASADPAGQNAPKGPITQKEIVAAAMLVLCVGLWIFEKRLGISATATAMAAAVFCFAAGLLEPKDLRVTMPWGLFLFLGTVFNFGLVFEEYGINDLIKTVLAPVFQGAGGPAGAILAAALITVLLRFIIVSQTASVVILMSVLLPLASASGVSPFILGFTILATQQIWFASYQNVVFSPALACMKETVAHRETVAASLVYIISAVAACMISIPYWGMLGYL